MKVLQKENNTFKADLQSALSDVRMYQSEITRLGTENNRLHLEMMKIKEQTSECQEKWRVSNKKLENEKSDLKVLNEIHKLKIQELESEKDHLKSKFESLYNKIYNPASQKSLKDPNLSSKSQNSVRKQEFRMSKPLSSSESVHLTKSQQEWAQELQDSDDRVKKYQEQVEDLIKLKEDLQEDVKILEERTRIREEEILRLSNILNSGEFAMKVPKRVAESNNEELIRTLNERLDLINSEFMNCEEELTLAKERLSQVGNVHQERDVLSLKLE
jgi:chromosome segregation ATPase